jgi:hypothetical protein
MLFYCLSCCFTFHIFKSLWLPTFNQMFNAVKITADYFNDVTLLLFIGGAVLLTTLLAGAYPAFYITRFNPSTIFRGTVKFGGTSCFQELCLACSFLLPSSRL